MPEQNKPSINLQKYSESKRYQAASRLGQKETISPEPLQVIGEKRDSFKPHLMNKYQYVATE
jgi:hypothetical protein